MSEHDKAMFDQAVRYREGQPCMCPDAHRESATYLWYCPYHGARPAADLWDYSAGTRYEVVDYTIDAPDGAVIEWPEFGPGLWARHGDEWVPHREATA